MEYEDVMKQMKIMLNIPDRGYFDRVFEQMCVDFLQNFDKMNVANTWLESQDMVVLNRKIYPDS